MLRVAEAQALVLEHARPLPPETLPLHAPSLLGLVLAEDVASDLDMPPYDKALMDGYAVRAADLPEGRGVLQVIEEIHAGETPTRPLASGQATRIMTGAPLPAGADAVVAVEKTRPLGDHQVQIEDQPLKPEKNLLRRGREMRRGDIVLRAGTLLRPQEIGLLATVGRAAVRAHAAPRLAVLSTGDELVEPPQLPGPGQIRNGNGPMLFAQAVRAGAQAFYLGIARDRLEELRPLVEQGLQSSILVLSGGVSAGQRDLVPGVLQELGVTAHFHQVKMKPGKPVFFGTRQRTLVFGLPGNPVSALVCFELFVRPAIQRLRNLPRPSAPLVQAILVEDFPYRSDRPTYHPARLELTPAGWRVQAVPWFGSPDLRGVAGANAFVVFPEGDHMHRAGQRFEVLRVEDDI